MTAKKSLKEIQELQKKITEDGRRYNKEGQLGVKARKEVLDLKYKQGWSLEGQIQKSPREVAVASKDRVKLDKELFNPQRKSKVSTKYDFILKGFGIQKSNKKLIESANKAREQGNIKEAQGLSKLEPQDKML